MENLLNDDSMGDNDDSDTTFYNESQNQRNENGNDIISMHNDERLIVADNNEVADLQNDNQSVVVVGNNVREGNNEIIGLQAQENAGQNQEENEIIMISDSDEENIPLIANYHQEQQIEESDDDDSTASGESIVYTSDEEDESINTLYFSRIIAEHTNLPTMQLFTLLSGAHPSTSSTVENDPVGNEIREQRREAMRSFYIRRSPINERTFHYVSDRTRMIFQNFDEMNSLDLRVNEVLRRYINNEREILPPVLNPEYLNGYMRSIMYVPRAQEMRWFHDMLLDETSPLYTELDIFDLFDRVRESFRGVPEP